MNHLFVQQPVHVKNSVPKSNNSLTKLLGAPQHTINGNMPNVANYPLVGTKLEFRNAYDFDARIRSVTNCLMLTTSGQVTRGSDLTRLLFHPVLEKFELRKFLFFLSTQVRIGPVRHMPGSDEEVQRVVTQLLDRRFGTSLHELLVLPFKLVQVMGRPVHSEGLSVDLVHSAKWLQEELTAEDRSTPQEPCMHLEGIIQTELEQRLAPLMNSNMMETANV